MKTNASRSVTPPRAATSRLAPSHEDIASRAKTIWHDRGRPTGSDDEIWLEAERQLHTQNLEPRGKDRRPTNEPDLGFNPKNRNMSGEIEERFPGQTGKETTSL